LEHIGIGPTLQEARLQRGKSIEEASRETRIRPEYLQALEGERFEALIGDVYVRAFLRSYSTYLGLDASQVLTIYNRHLGGSSFAPVDGAPASAPPRRGVLRAFPRLAPRDPSMSRGQRVGWPLVIAGTVGLVIVLAAVGLLARASSPKTGTPSDSLRALPPRVTVSVRATEPVSVTIVVDGERPQRFVLRRDEARSFDAASAIRIIIDHGGTSEVVVNGFPIGSPGQLGVPYSATFTPRDFRTAKPPASP
jgi:Helix-turn-helix domain